eukprot:790817-Amorphochlora_amoeboformis.AAC.2
MRWKIAPMEGGLIGLAALATPANLSRGCPRQGGDIIYHSDILRILYIMGSVGSGDTCPYWQFVNG